MHTAAQVINQICFWYSGYHFIISYFCRLLNLEIVQMLGPAPKWASFLDSLTEELEENPIQELYDDFKFITVKELESLGIYYMHFRCCCQQAFICNNYFFGKAYRTLLVHLYCVPTCMDTSWIFVYTTRPRLLPILLRIVSIERRKSKRKSKKHGRTVYKSRWFITVFPN